MTSQFVKNNLEYSAKVLLFGEYTATIGGSIFALPFQKYRSHWQFMSNNATDDHLLALATYLKSLPMASDYLDVAAFENDVQQGLTLTSTIPFGYGLGSSGNVVAAVYDTYSVQQTLDLPALKAVLAHMENFYHGHSSGIDPLVIYLRCPLYFDGVEWQKTAFPPLLSHFRLFDTSLSRTSSHHIAYFKEKSQQTVFKQALEDLEALNQRAIQTLLNDDADQLAATMHQISSWQWQHFRPMIPDSIHHRWLDGLDQGKNVMKLCGAGGGGFMLQYSDEPFQDGLTLPLIV